MEAAEARTANGICGKVQINDRRRKRSPAVVIAFDGQHVSTADCPRGDQYDGVGNVAARHENVGRHTLDSVSDGIVVR